ncbi:hypothetical protein DERF_012297 [Dermatophagoides farinae]|uniref:Uncharacterized protein n=1 Tax=Dermatophagoides farinae TaxID=6954 RepID=A0A922HPB5_DERFA|nr:hypothetical protein DERF_012297 [Dermatophagoides farinae]
MDIFRPILRIHSVCIPNHWPMAIINNVNLAIITAMIIKPMNGGKRIMNKNMPIVYYRLRLQFLNEIRKKNIKKLNCPST